jgi:hypothetical protein
VIDGRIAAAKSCGGSTLNCDPIRVRIRRLSSSTSVREFGSYPDARIGAPKVTKARER